MPILLGILAAVGIGISDYLGRYCTRRTNATTTVTTALIAGTAVALVLAQIIPSELTGRDFGLGAISGLMIGFALMLMYQGMAVSSVAVVSPLVALFVAVVPLVWDLLTGGSLSVLAAVGVAVAIAGILATTFSPDLQGRVAVGIVFAAVSGVLFGVGTTVVGETDIGSGVWPAVGQRVVALTTLLMYGLLKGVAPILPRRLRMRGLLSGAVGSAGIAMFILGTQRGSLGAVAVSSSMFPAVTAVLAWWFDDEPLRWWQTAGIGAVLVGIGLIAAG